MVRKKGSATSVAVRLLVKGADPHRKNWYDRGPVEFVVDVNDDEPIKILFVKR